MGLHLAQHLRGDIRRDRDTANPTLGIEPMRCRVFAGQLAEIRTTGHALHRDTRQISGRVFYAHNPGKLGQFTHGLWRHIDDGAGWDVVDDDGQRTGVMYGSEMRNQTALSGFVVIGRHHQDRIGPHAFGMTGKADRLNGVVGTSTGNHRDTAGGGLHHLLNHDLMLTVGQRGRLACCAHRHQAIRPLADVPFHKFLQCLQIQLAVAKRRDEGRQRTFKHVHAPLLCWPAACRAGTVRWSQRDLIARPIAICCKALASRSRELQAMTRILAVFAVFFMSALVALAERPRPLGWAMDAMRAGNWEVAATLAARDGQVAADVIEWHRLRAGRGSFDEVQAFLARRSDWPGEAYLRRQSEDAVIGRNDAEVLAFFATTAPQTPRGVLAHAAALARTGETGEAEANIVLAWRTMPMNATSQALFLAEHEALLKPHHVARLDAMLWAREHTEARQMFDLVSEAEVALAETRIALQRRQDNVNTLINALPAAQAGRAGLKHDRFEWRIRAGLRDSARDYLLETSKSAEALGRPEAWANRRRALAREEMREGNPRRAYLLASQHFLESGSHYADLEWLSGYIALRFLNEPAAAYEHFLNHDNAVRSPISQGRAGYWQGRALEALGMPEKAQAAYEAGAAYQTSFYGLLAAERANLPFDAALAGPPPEADWRSAPLAQDPLFEAGMLLQASGELSLAERFWTHLAEQLMADDIALLGQAAIDVGQPHLAVMIGKRAARRGLTIAAPYYALHPLAEADLPMAPEMSLAIARRESEFDPVVQSPVGARGLMQLMPGTAQDVASDLGVSAQHSTDRLTTDPVYNAQLGATYLSQMAGRFDGNVVMMSAAYNAGPARPTRWMATYGDPRTGRIDIVDWVEMVPFRETRNYIMRVTESLPVYRARLGQEPLPIPFTQELVGSTLKAFAPKGE